MTVQIEELYSALANVEEAEAHRTFIEGGFRAAFTCCPLGIAICDEEGDILFINNTLTEWLKEIRPLVSGKADLKGRPIKEFVEHPSFDVETRPVELAPGVYSNIGIQVPDAYPRAFASGRLTLVYVTRT